MRIVFFSLTIAILITFLSFTSVIYLEKTAYQLIENLQAVDKAVQEESWEKAKEALKIFEKKWDKKQLVWDLLIVHSEIENMQISVSHIKSYLSTKSLPEVRAEISALIKYLEHIPDIERLTLENIF